MKQYIDKDGKWVESKTTSDHIFARILLKRSMKIFHKEDLFTMYKNFLTWELSIEKIALYIKKKQVARGLTNHVDPGIEIGWVAGQIY